MAAALQQLSSQLQVHCTWPFILHCCPLTGCRWIHRFGWLDREAPVSYEYALENFFDVAHGPFTHDGMFGISAANNNPDLPTKVERTSTQLKFVTAPSEVPRADGTTLGPAIQMSLQFPVLAAAENYVADAAGERIQDVLKFVVYRYVA